MPEEGGRTTHPLLYVITTLLAINLAVTIWSVTRPLQESGSQSAASQELPKTLTKAEREGIFQDFRTYYNAENYNELYDMFDDLAKFDIQREQVSSVFGGMQKQFGQIADGIYTHYEYDGREDGMDWFTLFYKLSLGNGAANTGSLEVRVFYNGERYGIMGLHLGAK